MGGMKHTVCRKCRARDALQIVEREVTGLPAVTEHVVVCVQCGYTTHSCYTSAALDALLKEDSRETGNLARYQRLSAEYNQKFEEFQAAMAERMAKAGATA
jgi:Zn ribbon nucleic-acid-binding protein